MNEWSGISVAQWRVDAQANALHGNDAPVRLEPRVMQLLCCLIEHAGEVVTRTQLIDEVWGERVVEDDALSAAMIKLRKALGDSAKEPQYIETVPRVGYRLVAPAERAAAKNVEPIAQVLIGQSHQAPTVHPVRLNSTGVSIAVLPLQNLSSDPEQDYFAQGLTQDLITALCNISALRVVRGLTSSTSAQGTVDQRKLASDLNVRYLLDGSVQRSGERLRVNVMLFDSHSGSQLWAERFDRPVVDLFIVQDELTQKIAVALQLNLTHGEQALMVARGTANPEAWALCVRATQAHLRQDASGYLEARRLAEEATKLDAGYAHAWGILAHSFIFDARLSFIDEAESKFARAEKLARHAVSLDRTDLRAAHALIAVAASRGDYDAGIAIARRAIEDDPGSAAARAELGWALLYAARYNDSIAQWRTAVAMSSFTPLWYLTYLALALALTDELNEAAETIAEVLDLNPSVLPALLIRAYVYHQLGRLDAGAAIVRQIGRIAPNFCCLHVRSMFFINDVAAVARFTDSLRDLGLPSNPDN